MKRSVFVALAAVAAVAAIGASGAASAPALSAQTSMRSSAGPAVLQNHQGPLGGPQANRGALSARARRALQAAGDKDFVCEPASGTPVNTAMEQTCVITAPTGTCIERSDSPVVVQTCTFTQVGGATNKRATAIQVAATNKGPSPQEHTQIIDVDQTSTLSGSNFVDATQIVKQSLGPGHYDDTDVSEPEPTTSTTPPDTHQDFHQVVTVDQNAMGIGSNSSGISQFGKQRVRGKQAPSISQFQNTEPAVGVEICPAEDPNANMCSAVHQTSVSGQNVSTLKDTYSQFERAHKTTLPGTQQQGIEFGSGGIDHEIQQQSTGGGFCKIATAQSEQQVMRAVQADEAQVQHGPTRKDADSHQLCSLDSVWTGTQESSQVATSRPNEEAIGSLDFGAPALQTNLLEYIGTSSGSIQATQSVSQQMNGQPERAQNSCGPASACAIFITCLGGEACAPAPPPECEGEGEFRDPETGKCEEISIP